MMTRNPIRRRAAALIMALVAMAIITVVLTTITAQIVSQRQSVRHRQRQLQAEWLTRAGAEWAAAQLLQKPEAFTEEQQQFVPDSKTRIAVEKSADGTFRVTVDASVGMSEGRPVARTVTTTFRRAEKEGTVRLDTMPTKN